MRQHQGGASGMGDVPDPVEAIPGPGWVAVQVATD